MRRAPRPALVAEEVLVKGRTKVAGATPRGLAQRSTCAMNVALRWRSLQGRLALDAERLGRLAWLCLTLEDRDVSEGLGL